MAISRKLKINLSSFKLSDYYNWQKNGVLLTFLNIFDLVILLTLPVVVLAVNSLDTQLQIWVALVLAMVIARLIKALYWGPSVFPQVKYDLLLLTAVTIFLVLIILQGNGKTYLSLGGQYIWSVGTILLGSLSIYLLNTSSRRGILLRLFTLSMAVAAIISTLSVILSSTKTKIFTDGQLIDQAAISILMFVIGIAGTIYFKNKTFRSVFVIETAIAIFGFFLNFQLVSLIALTKALLIGGIILFFVTTEKKTRLITLKNFFKSFKSLTETKLNLSNLSIGLVALGLLTTVVTIANILLNIPSQTIVKLLITKYQAISQYLTNPGQFIIGIGATNIAPATVGLLVSFGLIGTAIGLFMSYKLIETAVNFIKASKNIRESIWGIGMLVSLIFSIVYLFLVTPTIGFILYFVGIVAIIYSLSFKQDKELQKYDLLPGQINFVRTSKRKALLAIMPADVWQDLFQTFRIILVICILIMTPQIVQFVLGLFH